MDRKDADFSQARHAKEGAAHSVGLLEYGLPGGKSRVLRVQTGVCQADWGEAPRSAPTKAPATSTTSTV
jgi:hypothetical protein